LKYLAISIVMSMLSSFLKRYPDVKVELNIDDAFAEIVAGDAGVRFG